MKEKIILFIIGVLVGAVISTGIFCVYTSMNKNNNSVDNTNTQMSIPGGMNNNGGTPPEKPDGEAPEMPSGNNNNNSSKATSN